MVRTLPVEEWHVIVCAPEERLTGATGVYPLGSPSMKTVHAPGDAVMMTRPTPFGGGGAARTDATGSDSIGTTGGSGISNEEGLGSAVAVEEEGAGGGDVPSALFGSEADGAAGGEIPRATVHMIP